MIAPGIDGVVADFGVHSSAISSIAMTIFLLGLALGPMFLSFTGEIYGRLPVYHAANIVFIAFMIGNALSKNITQFMVFRIISGGAGGMPLAMGGGTIADVTLPANRGLATALFSLGPLAGPVSRHPPLGIECWRLMRIPGARPCYRRFLSSSPWLALDLLAAGHPGRRC